MHYDWSIVLSFIVCCHYSGKKEWNEGNNSFATLIQEKHAVWWGAVVLTLLGRSRLALALQIAMTMGRFPSLQAMCSGVLPWRSCWSRWQWCLRRQRTTSTWHLRTARWRAVWPSWKDTQHKSSVTFVYFQKTQERERQEVSVEREVPSHTQTRDVAITWSV